MGISIGIDLGTTNTCIAVLEKRRPYVIPSSTQKNTLPSVVAFSHDKVLVGEPAKRQALINPVKTIYSIKRIIGRRFSDPIVQNARLHLPYQLIEGPDDSVQIKIGEQNYSPEQISAFVLKQAKDNAEDYLGKEIQSCVVTVPAYFSDQQRQATLSAAKIAGIEVSRIINEPTAAALAYGYNQKKNKTLAIYDLGGGTFDFTVLDVVDGVYRVLGTIGDTHLGGDDIDHVLTQRVRTYTMNQYGLDPDVDSVAMQRIRAACEQAKKDLSNHHHIEIHLPFLKIAENPPINLVMQLSRKELEELIKDLVDRTLKSCQACMDQAGLKKDDLDDVLLVGGQTRMPWVNDRVSNYFGRSVSSQLNADEVVAMGAALQAAKLDQGLEEEFILVDVIPKALGIKSAQGAFSKIMDANTSIPASQKKLFTNSDDNQGNVKIEIFEGLSQNVSENEKLGEMLLNSLPGARAGELSIEVEFRIDANGLLHVFAKDLDTGITQSIQLKTQKLSKKQIEDASVGLENLKSNILPPAEQRIDLPTRVAKLFQEVKIKFDFRKHEYDAKQIENANKLFDLIPLLVEEGETKRLDKAFETLQILKDQL